jgi:hypothetical protein
MKPRLGRQRVLREMERDLAGSDPRLTALFSSFTLLVQDEEMPVAERIVAWPLRMLGRLRGHAQPSGGWRAALQMVLCVPLLLSAVVYALSAVVYALSAVVYARLRPKTRVARHSPE